MSHPETKRWVGKLPALFNRHEILVQEMKKRGYNHHSPLNNEILISGSVIQDIFVNTPQEQIEILKTKKCECKVQVRS